MRRILENIPELPKRLSVIVNNEKLLLPGCSAVFHIQESKLLKNLIQSKMKSKESTSSLIIGVVHSTDVNTIGTAAKLHSTVNADEGLITLRGICRFRIRKLITNKPNTIVEITQIEKHEDCLDLQENPNIKNLVNEILNKISAILEIDPSQTQFARTEMMNLNKIIFYHMISKTQPCFLAEVCSNLLKCTFDEHLKLLNTLDVEERLKLILTMLNSKQKVDFKEPKLTVVSRPNILQNPELKKLKNRINEIKFEPDVGSIVQSELKELSMITPINPHYNILFSHLTLIADLPWNKQAEETLDLHKTKYDLEMDHYGLEEVKKRILEYLAVKKLRSSSEKSHQGPVICLVGPPGVGKTSIARSIASTLNRPFERVSLGGINNMTDIRGHRKAYIGAMPGRIIQAIKRSGVKNPIILLDEIDKMTYGIHGDPAAALLEVLDPAQNKEFLDHYLNIPFDLSQILFIATANSLRKLSPALKDRLEIIHLSGYTYLEKLQIADKYLVPKQLNETGLHSNQIQIPEETIRVLIHNYTHEAGVRALERKIGSLCRSVAVKIALNEENEIINFPMVIDIEATKDILGPLKIEKNKWISRIGKPGIAIGLVVNSAGGGTIAVESSFMPGSGKLVLTGSLGDVIKESAQLAWGWVRSNAHMYGIKLDGKRLKSIDVHVHFPSGAVNKDGPSAGVTVAASLMSLFLDCPLLPNIAMTGEITLQGVVLGVGGIKEKVIAAHNDGFRKIIIPQKNEKHLSDIPSSIKGDLTFVIVSDMHTIIETVFEDGINLLSQCLKSKL